jgi:hypothetical protein
MRGRNSGHSRSRVQHRGGRVRLGAAAALIAGGLALMGILGCGLMGHRKAPVLVITEMNAYLVPGSGLNAVRYGWNAASRPDLVWMEVRDRSGTVVRTVRDMPTRYVGGKGYAEQKWDALDEEGAVLTEAASAYDITVCGRWGGAVRGDHRPARVEEWLLPIEIAAGSAAVGRISSGPEEETITPETFIVTVTVDGGLSETPSYRVAKEFASGSHDWACVVTPMYKFYTSPALPYDIRYTLVMEQKTTTVERGGKLHLKTVMNYLLSPWDMDPSQEGRQTKGTWRFGLGCDTGGKFLPAARRDFTEAYE